MDEKMRAEFEEWYAHQVGCDIRKLEECRWGSKGYRDPFAANAWFAWQASRAALVIELPGRINKENGYIEDDEYYNLALKHCKHQIEAAGVRVKP